MTGKEPHVHRYRRTDPAARDPLDPALTLAPGRSARSTPPTAIEASLPWSLRRGARRGVSLSRAEHHEHRHRKPRARAAAPRPAVLRGRPRQGPLPGHRGHAAPHPGLRGRRHQAPGPRRARDVHGAQAVLRRRRRAHVPRALPKIEKIEVSARGDVRRAKLYYLRDRVGKRARVRERRTPAPSRRSRPACSTGDRGRGRRVRPDGRRGRRRGRRGRSRLRRHGRHDAAVDTTPRSTRPRRARRRPARRRRSPAAATPRAPPGPTRRRDSSLPPREEAQGGEDRRRSARRAGHHRRRGARARARHPGLPDQAVPHPERVDGSRRSRSASGSSSTGSATASATPRSARSSSSIRRPPPTTRRPGSAPAASAASTTATGAPARGPRRRRPTSTSSSASSPVPATPSRSSAAT